MDGNFWIMALIVFGVVWCFSVAMLVTYFIAVRAPDSLKHVADIIRSFGLSKIAKALGKALRR